MMPTVTIFGLSLGGEERSFVGDPRGVSLREAGGVSEDDTLIGDTSAFGSESTSVSLFFFFADFFFRVEDLGLTSIGSTSCGCSTFGEAFCDFTSGEGSSVFDLTFDLPFGDALGEDGLAFDGDFAFDRDFIFGDGSAFGSTLGDGSSVLGGSISCAYCGKVIEKDGASIYGNSRFALCHFHCSHQYE